MRQRLQSRWFDLQYTLWFVPSLMTLAAVLLAFFMLALDREILAAPDTHKSWLFEGGAEGARGVLSIIAGTMITVATTAFSITIVALQLGSSQFSPRILRGFTLDRGNQVVLGVFIATFAYAALVLRTVRSESADAEVFVPSASVSVAILMAFAAIASLIFFFHHATRAIQASVVIDRTARDTFRLIDDRLGRDAGEGGTIVEDSVHRDDLVEMAAGHSGYLVSIDMDALLDIAETHAIVISVQPQVGMHLLSITPLVAIPAPGLDRLSRTDRARLEDQLRGAFGLDIERTLEHDLVLGFRQLSDIAVKALSPGINDPTTAAMCIDRIGEALVRVRNLDAETRFLPAANGTGGVRYTSIGLQDIMRECLPQIRHYGADDVVISERLLQVLRDVAASAQPDTAAVLAHEARLVAGEAEQALMVPEDRQRIRRAVAWAGNA